MIFINVVILIVSIINLGLGCANLVINYSRNVPYNDIAFILHLIIICFSFVIVFFLPRYEEF